ncbi:putative DNA-binding domain-containing protein [Halarcobacter ebronensis]|uniref:Uncharacterized protein n=1 Tax=Halarcobacter ebronensis TaxID=1462615 RepID=A0A4Q1AUX7_9BACT|nr:putative DNA-binding domain-containing protein [Halarcobacter ebronensis]QKF80711.1 hypothetical protein AEBR_0194 [Halarcobacter ebronensis]RXK08505.1 hypothetical protein CRV07_01515 [Halarcobacter ebronensis]
MPKLEKEIQKRFFDNLINQSEDFENSAIEVYQKLVFQRYYEVIKNSFPLFMKEIEKEDLDKSIKAFMKDTPNTPFMWKVPKYYKNFVKKSALFDDKKYLYELLYFDWTEIEIYMKEYKSKKLGSFSFNESFKLSKSARVKRFKYDIVNKNYKEKRENFLVIYYDFQTNEVIYREINQLIYLLLKESKKSKTFKEILQKLCKANDIVYKEAENLLFKPLEELFEKRVFI